MTNPWLAALLGLIETAIFLGLLFGISEGLSFIVPFIIGRSREEWRRLRVEYFWLFGAIFAPITFGYFALASWALHFTASQIGFNFHNVGLSLGVALPVSIALGSVSGFAATLNARRGITPMHGVQFGRSLPEVIGMIGYMVLLVGPIEEIPFRGIIQTLLDNNMPQSFLHIKLGTIVAALIFVAYHYRNVLMKGESNTQFLLLAPGRTLISVILALLFQATGSLLGPILFHNIVDTFSISAVSITVYRMRQQGQWPPVLPDAAPEPPTVPRPAGG